MRPPRLQLARMIGGDSASFEQVCYPLPNNAHAGLLENARKSGKRQPAGPSEDCSPPVGILPASLVETNREARWANNEPRVRPFHGQDSAPRPTRHSQNRA
jgi:hypothetical protein